MKRVGLDSRGQALARKKIAALKSDKRFAAALSDRDDRSHEEAVEQWTRLHDVAFSNERRVARRETGSQGIARQTMKSNSAGSADSPGRLELADSGIDDWEADRTREARGRRGEDGSVGAGLPPEAGQQPVPGSAGALSGFWIVDQGGRDFVLVNPVTDRPVVDEQGRRVIASPEAFEETVPPAVRPFQNALLSIWQIDRIPDDVAVGTESGVVFGIMLDMLRVRGMPAEERRQLRRRIAELPERFGRDWNVVSGHLRGRMQRAIDEPFWFPAILTDEELESHRSMSRTLETIGEVGRISGPGAGAFAAGKQATILGSLGLAVPFVLATGASTVVDEHHESRAEAYEAEIRRRRLPNVWPPAPDSR